MPNKYWLDINGNLSDTANWSGGTLPQAGDIIFFNLGNKNITSGLSQFQNTNNLIIFVGNNYTGSIGTTSSPMLTGTGTTIRLNSPLVKFVHFSPSGGSMFSKLTPPNPSSTLISGTLSNIYIYGSSNLTCACTVSSVYIESFESTLVIEPQAAITALVAIQGSITSYGSLSNLYIHDANVNLLGSTATIASVHLFGKARLNWNNQANITNAYIYGGTLDGEENVHQRTVTNAYVHAGGRLLLNNNMNNISGTINQYGGYIRVGDNATVVVYVPYNDFMAPPR